MEIRVLLIDDDQRLCDLLRTYLSGHGFSLTVANTGAEGLRQMRTHEFDSVLLDLMLPDADGLEVLRGLRQTTPSIPVIMLTAKGADEDKIVGLEVGADDYIAKPFNPRELVARIKAVLRRKGPVDPDEDLRPIEYDGFSLSPAQRNVKIESREIALTSAEFRLLKLLAGNPGRVFTRERLMDVVQGRDFDGIDRSIDVHISRLRNKIEEDPKRPRWIRTVWGTGYVFQK